jgi:hypothetical protein
VHTATAQGNQNNEETEHTMAIGSVETSETRTRTSPRINVCNTIISLIKSGISTNDLKNQVIAMRDNPTTIQMKAGGGSHYVVVSIDNTRTHLQSSKVPTKSNNITACYGPYRTRKGADYVVDNGVRASDKRIF